MNNYENILMIPQPKNIKVKLFRHQLASIYQMEKLEREKVIENGNRIIETNIGINADPPGYGKTITMIGLIVRDKMEWDLDVPFVFENIIPSAGGRIKSRVVNRFEKLPSTLVLASQSVIGQWEEEFMSTELKVVKILTKRDIDNVDPVNYDVVIVIPTLYNVLMATHSRYAWKRFIHDEPGEVRVPSMKEIHAGFFWLVTATPNAIIERHRMCVNNFMNDIIGNSWDDFQTHFTGLILRNDINFVRLSFVLPEITYHHHQCFQPVFNTLDGFVSPHVKVMIDAGNIEGAIIALGGCRTDNIVDVVQHKKKEEVEDIDTKIMLYTRRQDETKIKEWSDKKFRVLSQLEEIKTRFQDILKGQCGICLENIISPVLEPSCQNVFCGKCLLTWTHTRNSCPLCRCNIVANELIYINSANGETEVDNIKQSRELTKLEKIIEIIKDIDDGKIIIFSAYNNTFSPICNALLDNDVTFVEVKGTAKTRQKNIYSFKKGNVSVIFLNSTINSAGINLQEASDIILYHKMDETTETQIIGRANRVGRTTPLKVHYLQIKK